MRYVECPATYKPFGKLPSLFLAGGITNCPDWRSEVVEMLEGSVLTVFNPRRNNFPINDPSAARKQIEWEHEHLRLATMILFWFPCETLCPIVLYELGDWSKTTKPIFVGCHPDYLRKRDVEIQTGLARQEVEVVDSLDKLVRRVLGWTADYMEIY